MGDLTVTLYGEPIGRLTDAGTDFDFVAVRGAVSRFGLGSRVLSVAVPLVPINTPRQRRARQTFFAELLPEAAARTRLAQQAGIRDENDVIAMLRAYGRDVAGAIQIWDPDVPGEPRTPRREPLDEEGVATLLRDVGSAPLGNSRHGGKTSLNGVQDKIVLVRTEHSWARALDGYPSTHLLKPIVPRYPSMIFDEEYGSRFARALGLATFDSTIASFAGTPALVIERYDRDANLPEGRVHQEDFNQILGCRGNEKYEIYGHEGLRNVASVLGGDDRAKLLRMVTLSVALGNLDLHLKNIALLHDEEGGTALAPMYDVVPQNFPEYRNDGEVALAVAGVFEFARLHTGHIITEGESWGVQDAADIVREALEETARVAASETPHAAAHVGLQAQIDLVTKNLLRGLTTAGESPGRSADAHDTSRGDGAWTWENRRG